MDENIFWVRIVVSIALAISVVTATVLWYNDRLNSMRFAAWQQCIAAGGEPKDEGIVGSNDTTFTCDIKQ